MISEANAAHLREWITRRERDVQELEEMWTRVSDEGTNDDDAT